jgi:glucose-6-phosphate 1-dehydrogenase
MKGYTSPDPCVVVIFGAGGDLTRRKLIPALYNLYLDKWLPPKFAVIGIDRKALPDDEFRAEMRKSVDEFSRRGKTEDAVWNEFAGSLTHLPIDATKGECFGALADRLAAQDKAWGLKANRIFYLSVPPSAFEPIARGLGKAKLARDRKCSRLVVEKPFGRDLASARGLNAALIEVFNESQLFRIDHYLGKETVQNILAFRFANSLFEPVWNQHYIDHVQITVAEQVGVEHRGGYYDHAGALRDMVQNHLLQILCLIAMEPPVSYQADEIRNKKVDVLRAIRPTPVESRHRFAVRGQYDTGWMQGECVRPYRAEEGVPKESNTDTYVALKLFVDNWRWQGVPFYLRTGKRLPARTSEAAIVFRPVPHQSFPPEAVVQLQPNRLVMRLQPEEAILLRFQAKRPGEAMLLTPVDMRFTYEEAFNVSPPEAYETLLLDVMLKDATQFMRADQQEAAWTVITPVLEAWETAPATDFPNYPAGSWGPEAAETLIAQDGRSWLLPTLPGYASCKVTPVRPEDSGPEGEATTP